MSFDLIFLFCADALEFMILLSEFVVLAVIAGVCACVIYPVHFRVRFHRGLARLRLRLDYCTGPLCGVLVMHFFDILSLEDICSSLVAVGHVQPLAVLLIFFTLAYASISLDVTGFSKYVALRVLGGATDVGVPRLDTTTQPGRLLLLRVYLLSGFIALVASNDVVVLTLTPVLLHYCELRRMEPHNVVFASYVAANTWSAFLLVGNPTNIIAGQAMQMSFAEYLTLLWMPTTVVVCMSLGTIWFAERHSTPAAFSLKDDHSVSALPVSDGSSTLCEARIHAEVLEELPAYAVDGSVLPMGGPEALCTGREHRPVPPLLHPSPSMDAISASVDAASPLPVPPHVAQTVLELGELRNASFVEPIVSLPLGYTCALSDPVGAVANSVILAFGIVLLMLCGYTSFPMYAVTSVTCAVMLLLDCFRSRTEGPRPDPSLGVIRAWWRASRAAQVAQRMPWSVAPFACSMFVLVDLLSRKGITQVCASVLVSGAEQLGHFWTTMVAMCVVVCAMNLLNNQPATILLSVVLIHAAFPTSAEQPSGADAEREPRLSDRVRVSLFVVLALGSNIAAVFTPKGALAGILWESILHHHRITMPFRRFLITGLRWMLLPMAVGGVVSYAVPIVVSFD